MSIVELLNQSQGILLLIGAVVFAFTQYLSGKKLNDSTAVDSANSTIEILNARIDAQAERITELQDITKSQREDIVRLQEQMKLKDDTIKKYLEILQNRNPELEKFMKSVSDSLAIAVRGIESLLEGQKHLLRQPAVQINNTPTNV